MAHGGGAATILANAIKASGVVIHVDPADFLKILAKTQQPLIVYARGGFFDPPHQYLTSYKGLAFFAKSQEQIDLPRTVEVIIAKKIWLPK